VPTDSRDARSYAARVSPPAPLINAPLPPVLYAEIPATLTAGLSDGLTDGRGFADGAAVLTLPQLSDELTPQVSASRTSRAGRNLPAAIGVGLALGAMIVASLLAYRPSFVVIICAAMAYGIYEMTRAIGAAEARPPLVPLVAGGLAMDVAAWYQGANALVLGLLLTVLGVTVWRLAEGAVGYARDVTSAAFIALYVPLLGGFAVLLTHYSDGAGRVIAFIATVVCSDVGGYVAGVLFGKHPMAPTVSPKKSWEGFVGSALACSIGGALFMSLLFHHRWWIGVLYGLAIAVTATLGDLGESMVKRDLGVKDMGRLLPGHGGLMDRLDSLLPCAAVAYLILSAAL
jgi:phosphatidate cytidylyltransferase